MKPKKVDPKTYNVEREIATLEDKGNVQVRLNFMSWNGRPARYDIRTWVKRQDGKFVPQKGYPLSEKAARELRKALNKEFNRKEKS